VVKTFLDAGCNKQPIEVWGQGRRRNQYRYVDDLVEGSVLVIDKVNEVYNLISPEETTMRELAELLQAKYGFEVVFNTQRLEGASMPYLSSRKAITELSWKPISLEDGIERMVKERFRVSLEKHRSNQ
jgi:nucleoside-diphosphate-sugar epimerase